MDREFHDLKKFYALVTDFTTVRVETESLNTTVGFMHQLDLKRAFINGMRCEDESI